MKNNEKTTEYTVTPSGDGQYIILKIRGVINRRTAMKQNLEAHALGKKLGIRRYFVDVTEARNNDTALDSYNFAYQDMNGAEGIDKYARVVTLVSPGDHSHDFIETVARNAGLNVKLFTDPDEAREHLLKK